MLEKMRQGSGVFDVIVVGGGHNGLVCGAYLAKAGLNVCVLERRHLIGGAAVTEEPWPGYRVSTLSFYLGLLLPKVIEDLELFDYGLEVLPTPPLFQPFLDGRSLIYYSDLRQTCAQIAQFSRKDAEAYPAYRAYVSKLAGVLRRLLWETPVDPSTGRISDLVDTGKLIWRLRDERGLFHDIGDLLTLSAFDFLDRWFENNQIKASLGFYATAGGSFRSLHSPGTALFLVRQAIQDPAKQLFAPGFVKGGMGRVSEAIAASGKRFGMQVRTDADVSKILIESDKARGVALSNGDELRAKVVVSNADVKTTLLRLTDTSHLPSEMVRNIEKYRGVGSGFRINLAVEQPPTYKAFDRTRAGFAYPAQVKIAPSLEYLEQAYDDAKYGRLAARPFVNINVPSAVDPSLAPPGKYVINVWAGHVPYEPQNGGWDNRARDQLLQSVVDVLADYAPGFGNGIIHKQIITPTDMATIYGLPNGHIHHGDITLDQMFFRRPVPGCSDYRTPVPGLYLCGSSSHPGGGVTGGPGHNAAREVLRDWKSRKVRRSLS